MFSYDSLIEIRKLEAFLYEGPEMVEQLYERNDNFSSMPMRRRNRIERDLISDYQSNESEILYSYFIDPTTNDIVYNLSK